MSSNTPAAPGTKIAAVDNLPINQKAQEIGAYLNQRIATIEEVLPSNFKHEGQRLIKRAMIYFASRPELHDVAVNSFITCVVQAAELGLALDGKLCHAVAFNCNIAPKGKPAQWEKRAQCMADYKGLVAVAKRSNQIADMDGDVVGFNDHYKYGMVGATQVFEYTPNPDGHGEIRGAFARVILPNGLWAVEYMSLKQLEHVRDKSKAKDFGPWKTDTEQMMVKTVIRRLLKMYCDDPTFVRATEIDDLADVIEGEIVSRPHDNRSKARVSTLDITPPPAIAPPAAPGMTIPPKDSQKREEEPSPPSKPHSQRKREEQQQESSQHDAPPEGEQSQGDVEQGGEQEGGGPPSIFEQLLLKAQEANTAEGFDMVEKQIKEASADDVNDGQYEELMTIVDEGRKKLAPKRGK